MPSDGSNNLIFLDQVKRHSEIVNEMKEKDSMIIIFLAAIFGISKKLILSQAMCPDNGWQAELT